MALLYTTAPHRDHRGIVAAAPVIAQQHAGDQRRVLRGEPGIGGEVPAAGQPVGVQDDQRIAGEVVGELADARRDMPGRAVVRDHVARLARV